MEATLNLAGFEEVLLRVARDGARLALAQQAEPAPWMGIKTAAGYLDTTEDAIRGLVKRRQIPCHRSENGRLLFRREELDVWAGGEAV